MATIVGQMADITKANGRITICTVSGDILGQTDDATRVTTRTTRSMAMVFTLGRTAASMTACGRTVGSTARAPIITKVARGEADGKMGEELSG